jgi:hypothetical protein
MYVYIYIISNFMVKGLDFHTSPYNVGQVYILLTSIWHDIHNDIEAQIIVVFYFEGIGSIFRLKQHESSTNYIISITNWLQDVVDHF